MDSPDFDMDDGPAVASQVQRKPAGDAGVPAEVIGQGADYGISRPKPPQREYARNGTAPSRQMPASAEAEEHVIACILLDGGEQSQDGALTYPTLTRAADAGLTTDSFYWPANQLLMETALALRSSLRPVTLEVMAEELATSRLLDHIGGFPYLMQVTGKIPTTAHAGYFIEKVREKELLRQAIKAGTTTVEEAYAHTSGLDEFLQRAKARTDALAESSVTTTSRLAKAASDLDARRVQISSAPTEPQTRLYLAGKPIATPGNLTTVTSKAKTGKTTTLSAAAAAIVAAWSDRKDRDTFKFTAPHNSDQSVIVIDTEQSQYDSWLCYERGLKRAGETTDPKWLMHYSLVGYTPEQVKAAILLALERGKTLHKGVFILILDGVADLVASVNDEIECNALVVWLRALSVSYDCPIICVIHSNESALSGDDGRGHLGKQLIRKAESNLVLKKVDDITTITSEKQRKAPITEQDGVSFQWSDEAQMHVSCKSPEEKKRGPKKSHHLENYLSVFPKTEVASKPFPQILNFADAKRPISRNTLWGLIEAGVSTGEIQVNNANVNEPRYWVSQ